MDVGGSSLPNTVNPYNFPAKLWRLVNNPAHEAICWDSEGTGIVIARHLFERQVLSAGSITSDGGAFRTTNFQSFIRQLHLYGFKRKHHADSRHYFFNPNFKRNHPELVVNLRRAASISTKMQAGLEVCQWTQCLLQLVNGGEFNNADVTTDTLLGPPRQDSTPPHDSNKRQQTTPYNGTPVPPRHIKRRCGAPLSPSVFVSDNRMPASLCHCCSDPFLISNARHSQQGLLAHAHPNVPTSTPPDAQHQPCHCSTASKLYQPKFMASHLTASGLQAVQVSPQASYSVDKENQEVKNCYIDLEAISQTGDEAMPPLPNSCLARAVTPDKPDPGNPAIPMNANLLCPQPIIKAVSNNAYVVRRRQEEELVHPSSEQMPDDAIIQDIVMMERSTGEQSVRLPTAAAQQAHQMFRSQHID